jgi:hypothetical protein
MRPLCLAAALLLCHVVPAVAGDAIVLESYTSSRPDDASTSLKPVIDELAARSFVVGPNVIAKFEARASTPALSPEGLPTDFADQVEKGHRAFLTGKFEEAVAILQPLTNAARANPGAFAQNQLLREKLLKASIALALSQSRQGQLDASQSTFGEILRSFPDATVPRGTYGPEASTQFEQLRSKLASSGRGRLLVKINNEAAVVFVNERFEHVGTTIKPDLYPGEYRVFAQVGKALTRSHRVIVKANEDVTVTIDAGFDIAVQTSGKWVGLQFDTAADREKLESTYAAAFANAIDAKAVVVVGLDQVRGRTAVVGTLVNLLNGREMRRASLAIDPAPPNDRLKALASFLAGGEATGGIDVQLDGGAGGPTTPVAGHGGAGPVESAHSRASSPRWGGWTWIAGGATVVAAGTGIVLLSYDGRCPVAKVGNTCPDPNVYNTATPGWIAVGGAAVLAGVTVYLIATRHGSAPSRTAFVAPTSDGAVAGLAGSF